MISTEVLLSRLPVGSSASSDVGLGDDGAGDGDALLLAAGELGRRMDPTSRASPTLPKRRHRAGAPLRLVLAAIEQRQARHSRARWCGRAG